VLQGDPHHLARIGKRTATERHDQIGARCPCRLRRRKNRIARRVRRHLVVESRITAAERVAHLRDLAGRAVHRAAHHEKNATGIQALGFIAQHGGSRLAVDDALDRGKNELSC
jgi:hypothetical protein